MRRVRVAVALAAAVGLLLVGLQAGPAMANVVRHAALSGTAEIPGPGDADGVGTASISIKPGRGLVCWTIDVQNIELPATLSHIHRGDATVAGPIVVHLTPPDATGHSEGCTTVDKGLAKEIARNFSGFYVNVHNNPFPAGAVRGQLQPKRARR